MVAAVLATRSQNLVFPAYNWDEPAMMAESWAALHGQALYRDIYQIHPPLQFLVFMPFFLLFPPEVAPIAVRCFNLLLVYLGAWVVRKFFLHLDNTAATFAAVLFVLFLGQEWATSSHGDFYSVFPMLFSSYFILCRKDFSLLTASAVGFLWGIAFFFKQTAFFEAIALFLIFLFFRKNKISTKVSETTAILLGFIAATILSFSYGLIQGTGPATADAVVFRNVRLYTDSDKNSFLGADNNLLQAFAQAIGIFLNEVSSLRIVFYALLLLWFVALIFAGKNTASKASVSHRSIRLYLIASLLWFGHILVGVAFAGRFYNHYLIPTVTPVVLFFTSWFLMVQPKIRKTLLVAAIVLSLFGAGSLFIHNWSKRSAASAVENRSHQIADFVKKHTDSEDRLFLIEECYLDIYYLAERKSPNGIYMYLDMDSDHTHDVSEEKRKRQEFVASLPKAIIWGSCSQYPADLFYSDIIASRYFLRANIQGAKIFFLK